MTVELFFGVHFFGSLAHVGDTYSKHRRVCCIIAYFDSPIDAKPCDNLGITWVCSELTGIRRRKGEDRDQETCSHSGEYAAKQRRQERFSPVRFGKERSRQSILGSFLESTENES